MTDPSADFATAARRRAGAAWRRAQAAQASTEWPQFAPPVGLAAGPLGAVQAADREIARQTAVRARAVAEFAAARPASVDRPQGVKGAMSPERWAGRAEVLRQVSEWATPELAVALALSQPAAEALLERSLTLVGRLPGTLAALAAGALHPGHLWCLLEHVAPIADDAVRAEVEAGLLRWAAGRVITPAQLGARARREVAKRDARAAVRRLARAIRERGVFLRPGPVDGMASVTAVCTLPEALALYRTLQALVDALDPAPADTRSRGQKLLDVLADLVLRPGEGERPPVQVALTVVAAMGTLLGGDEPGEIDGQPVPAEMIRHLLHTLTGHPPADTAAPAPAGSPGGGRADWADWWAAWEAQADDELPPDPDPEPTPAEVLLALWNTQPPDPVDPGERTDPDPVDPIDLDPNDLDPPDLDPPGEPPAHEPPPGAAPPGGSPPGPARAEGGWWAAADRAVAEAGAALRRSVQALGHARRLVDTARIADAADETGWRRGPAGRVDAAPTAVEQLAAAGEAQRDWLAGLLAATGGGGLADRPRIALTDALSGTLLALGDLPGLRRTGCCGRPACRRRPERCGHDLTGRPGLGPPPATDGYRPGADLDRFVRARDRRCRFPGCRRRVPSGGELDHNRPYPDGPTAAANLTGFCTGDHRGKHQAPGWTYQLTPDGTLTVTTPTGLTTSTDPPPY